MPANAQEIASAIVRFVGDLKPLQRDTAAAKKEVDSLSKSNFGSSLSNAALQAGRSMLDLSKNIFYVREALTTVVNLAGTFARAFLQPAMELEKTRNALIGIMGSSAQADALLGQLSETANKFGLNLKELQQNAVSLAVISEGDVAVANEYAMALARINSLRPDLPQQRQLGVIFALREGDFSRASMLLDIPKEKLEALAGQAETTAAEVSDAVGDIAGGGEQALGQYTSIVRQAEGTGACGKSLAENLKKGLSTDAINALLSALGASDEMMGLVGDSMASKLQKLQNHWLEFKQTVGMKVLEALAGPMDNLLTWLDENQDKLVELAETFGGLLAEGVQKFLEWLTPERLDSIATSIINIAGAVGNLVAGFLAMPSWAQALIAGGLLMPKAAGGLLGGAGKAILGGAGKLLGLGGTAAGGAAAAGTTAGAGGAAAAGGVTTAGGAAAAAGGLTALGVGASVLGGVGLGFGVNELLSRTEWGQEMGAQPTKNIAGVGAYGLGKLFGGEELGQKWFSGVTGITPEASAIAPQAQQVEVVVTVDDSGALQAYTRGEIGRNNDELGSGFIGGGMRGSLPAFGGWGAR